MPFPLDADGRLDLSECFRGFGCDWLKASELSHAYLRAELVNLVAWDGKRIDGLQFESTWLHLVCKHNMGKLQFNPLLHLDIERVRRLPILKRVVEGRIPSELYRQERGNGKVDYLHIIISGADKDYLVILGDLGDRYVLRSAYPAGEHYIRKVKARSVFLKEIRSGITKAPDFGSEAGHIQSSKQRTYPHYCL